MKKVDVTVDVTCNGRCILAWAALLSSLATVSCRNNSSQGTSNGISLAQIEQLGATPTMQDLAASIGYMPLMEVGYAELPAIEGGYYIFSTLPTNEVPSSALATAERLPIVAIIKSDAVGPYVTPKGKYVFPADVAGREFTGFRLN